MGFVFDSLLIIIAQVTCSILGYFTGGFWDSFTIPAIDSESWNFTGLSATGQFDYYFPGMIQLKDIFKILGGFFATILAGLAFMKAMIPDFISGEKTDHPAATVFRFAMSGILVVNAYGVLGIIQEPLKEMCDQIRGLTTTSKNFSGNLDVNMWETLINATNNNGVFGNIPMLSDGSAILKGILTGGAGGAADAAQATIAQRASLVLVLICMILVGWLFIKLVLEMIERYVVMGFLFYCAPLAFGFYATTNTSQITKKYMQMMISQYILIMFNFIFLYIFIASFSRIGDVIAGTPDTSTIGGEAIKNAFLGSKTTEDYSGKNVVIFCFVMAAWLRLGARIDEMIQSLGISAARTGAGLGMELGAAVGTTLGAARTVKGGLQRLRSANVGNAAQSRTGGGGKDAPIGGKPTTNHTEARQGFEDNFGSKGGALGYNTAKNVTDGIQNGTMVRNEDGSYSGKTIEGNDISFVPEGHPDYDVNGIGAHIKGADGQNYFAQATEGPTGNANDFAMQEAIGTNDLMSKINSDKSYSEPMVLENKPGRINVKESKDLGKGYVEKTEYNIFARGSITPDMRQKLLKQGGVIDNRLNGAIKIKAGEPWTEEKTPVK